MHDRFGELAKESVSTSQNLGGHFLPEVSN